MRIRQKPVATDTWRPLGCRTTPVEHWSKRKPTVSSLWAQWVAKDSRFLHADSEDHPGSFIGNCTQVLHFVAV